MSEGNGIKTRRDLEVAVLKKALADDSYRQQLFASPRAAVERALAEQAPGARLPDGLDIKAFEEPSDSLYLVIPHAATVAELSDAELERVAGGLSGVEVTGGISWSR